MKGVEILSSVEVEVAWAFNWQVAVIIFFVCLVFFLIVGFNVDKDYVKEIFLPLGLLVGFFGGVLGGGIISTPTEYVTEHKVIISEEVSLQDFIEKYEIVGQEGKMYIVREK